MRIPVPILVAAGLVSLGPVAAADREAPLEEVTVTAQHSKLDWAQRNALVQKAATFVFGIADAPDYGAWPPIWAAPVCPLVTGLRPD